MGKFEVGDIVRKKNGGEFSRGNYTAKVSYIDVGMKDFKVFFEGIGWLCEHKLELVEKKVKKYKLETEFTLEDIVKLRILLCATDVAEDGVFYYSLGDILRAEGVVGWGDLNLRASNEGIIDISTTRLKQFAKDVLKRKVVTIGDKKYYEDELQTALANIKPL